MEKYTVRVGNQNEPILYINGLMSRCPFTPPLLVPDRITGQASISMIPCSLLCPHAKIVESADGKVEYVTLCTGTKTTLEVETAQQSLPISSAPNSFLRTT